MEQDLEQSILPELESRFNMASSNYLGTALRMEASVSTSKSSVQTNLERDLVYGISTIKKRDKARSKGLTM
jgi:hypothetical protein